MNNNNPPIVIISIVLILASVAMLYFLVLPQFEKIGLQEKEILDLEYKLENTTSYFNKVKENVEELEKTNWEMATKKIDANFMDGPFFNHNMDAYLKELVVQSGLYLKELNIQRGEEVSKTQSTEETNTNTASESTLREVSISFDLSGDYKYLRKLLDIFEKQALIIRINKIEITSGSGTSELSFLEEEDSGITTANLNIKLQGVISSK